ncbi:MAG: cyclic nucleotide-binding domain-containing protein [Rhodocyclaceae bacterium]|nr:cyclic nucleotide-binding domain-containing protein [Rhodocyclaceae bacterium]MDZ4216674.1 cyclic nucleotide-binding domain-containing protein [Rhodocyclaceae bacterium]
MTVPTAPSVTPESLRHLSPLGNLGADALAQVASLAHNQRLDRELDDMPYPWPHQVVYLLHGELKLGYAQGMSKVVVGGSGTALAPLASVGMEPSHIRPITQADLLCFDENALDILVTWDQMVPAHQHGNDVQPSSAATDWRNMSGLFDAQRLTFGTFSSLPPAHIESLLASFERQTVKAGDVIVRQNEPGDFYYVIERGRAQVTRSVAGASIDLAELKAGDAFGEEALIAETCRNATVAMKTDGVLLRLNSADFTRLLREPLLHYVDMNQAKGRVAAGAVWLDVRFPVECRHDGLPGALNIPLNELRDALASLPRDKEYIVYCQTGRRSSAAAFLLSQRGFRAGLLAGGLKSMGCVEGLAA